MQHAIGSTVEILGKLYYVVESPTCDGCAFFEHIEVCDSLTCASFTRTDNKSVSYRLVLRNDKTG